VVTLFGTGVSGSTILLLIEFCYGVYNQCELFIYLDLMVKNRKILIESYVKWWTSTKLV
jgi:hypothetical protein